MDDPRRTMRPLSRRALTVLTVAVAALIGAFFGALLAVQQRWSAGEPVCTSGRSPFPTPVCEAPLEASPAALFASSLTGAVLLALLAGAGLAAVRRIKR
jgi:hypothetical protein